ncbi:uncharacterized protein LOC122385481 [Amphibalanus amphitrite]|uniref:uncharacterized protein LOC122385481 n=1 Tax=Amphibalanus amphitrite TaxID=1232801 RepID=UPI001C8FF025|nr:uncharacterized protein LOC122385481 [Amphibalanus amphitrite]
MAVMAGLRSLLVFVSLSVSVSHGCSLYGICDIPCCDVTPSCSNAIRVDCSDCRDIDVITLTGGYVPPSVQELFISARYLVTIRSQALFNLRSLRRLVIDLNYAGTLNVDENGLTFPKNTNIREIQIENADIVTLATSAFGGFLRYDTEIELDHIKRLVMHQNSFNFTSNVIGPKIYIERVDELQLPPHSLNAPIRGLVLSEVKMKTCLYGSLSGNISHINLIKVKMNEVRKGCIRATRLDELSIISSELGTVRSKGIYGKLDSLCIRNTNFSHIEQEGLSLSVTTLRIKKSKLGELDPQSLKVSARELINLDDINISKLRIRGLSGLLLSNAWGGSQETDIQQTLSITNMAVQDFDEGALAFSEQTTIALYGYLKVPVPGENCPRDEWLYRLVGKPQGFTLSDNDKTVFGKLRRSWNCAGSKALTTATPAIRYESNQSRDEPGDTARAPHHTSIPSPETTSSTAPSEGTTDGTFEKDSTITPPGDNGQRPEPSNGHASLAWLVSIPVLIGIVLVVYISYKRGLGEQFGCIKRENDTSQNSRTPQPSKEETKGESEGEQFMQPGGSEADSQKS